MKLSIAKAILAALLLCSPALAQLDFHETFEGGVCGESWVTVGCPTTLVNAATLTGSYYLDKDDGTQRLMEGLAAGEVWAEIQIRVDGVTSANDTFLVFEDSSNVVQCQFFVDNSPAELLRIINTGGTTTNTPDSLTVDTNFIVEMRAKKGTGANAECAVRVNGGSWTTVSNGTWTADIHAVEIRQTDANGSNFFFDELKICLAGSIGDGVCDPPVASCTILVDGLCAN